MKKTFFTILVTCAAIMLIACSATQTNVVPATVAGDIDQSVNNSKGVGQMPQAMQLALGTLNLDQSEYPIGSDQAGELLPLWQAARSLSNSETAANEELNGLLEQIQETMTADQIRAIEAMDFKMQDLAAISQEPGFNIDPTGGPDPALADSSTQTANQSAEGGFGGPMPGDGGGSGGLPGGPGGPAAPASGANGLNSQSESSPQGSFLGLSTSVLDQVIQFLEAKI